MDRDRSFDFMLQESRKLPDSIVLLSLDAQGSCDYSVAFVAISQMVGKR